MFSPILEVHTKVTNSKVKDIPEVRVPSSSLIPVSPSPVLGRTTSPSWDLVVASSQFVVLVPKLIETPIMDYSGIPDNDLPNTPMGSTNIVVLSNSASLGHLDVPRAEADSEVHFKMFPTLEVPLVISSRVEMPSL